MRLLPAHTRDAKEMARALCESFESLGVLADYRDPEAEPPSLQQTQELMAKAMGYAGGWRELNDALKRPHRPIYMDGTAMSDFADRLARLLGFDYTHGVVLRAIECSGVGFSPKTRRSLQATATPWGAIDESEELAEGIVRVTTPHHGGWLLSPERQERMPPHLKLQSAAYEEDGEFYLVVLGFPGEEPFKNDVRNALHHVGLLDLDPTQRSHGDAVKKMRDETVAAATTAIAAGDRAAAAAAGKRFMNFVVAPYVPPPLSPIESEVVAYLAKCVYQNRRPIRFVGDEPDHSEILEYPTLAQWVETLREAPRVDGEWPTRSGPWRTHWTWTVLADLRQEAMERAWDRAFDPLQER